MGASAADLIRTLDGALARAGEDIILRRTVGKAPNAQSSDVKVRGCVRTLKPEEFTPGAVEGDQGVIISPTQIRAKGWPGGGQETSPPYDIPQWLPRVNDRVIVLGRVRSVGFVKPFVVGGDIVRIELTVTG